MTDRRSIDGHRALLLMGTLIGLSVALGACNSTSGDLVTATVPDDFRLRHPIVVEEATHSIVGFGGHARGGRSPSQRAAITGRPRTCAPNGTVPTVADVP